MNFTFFMAFSTKTGDKQTAQNAHIHRETHCLLLSLFYVCDARVKHKNQINFRQTKMLTVFSSLVSFELSFLLSCCCCCRDCSLLFAEPPFSFVVITWVFFCFKLRYFEHLFSSIYKHFKLVIFYNNVLFRFLKLTTI